MPGFWKRLFGDRGERAAARYLRRSGFKIVSRQASNRFGEIDLICLEGDTVVFVEVKTRRTSDAGHPSEAVTTDKQRKLSRTAIAWLKHRGLMDRSARFDVVSVVWPPHRKQPDIEHVRHAFEPDL